MKLGEAIYKSQQKNSTEQKTESDQDSKDQGQQKENVVDADFEDVKDEKDKDKDKDKEKRAYDKKKMSINIWQKEIIMMSWVQQNLPPLKK